MNELREAILGNPRVTLVGSGSGRAFHSGERGVEVQVKLRGIVGHDVDDQVVAVWAGTPIEELQAGLAEHGQCIPVDPGGTVGGRIALNLPHSFEADCGTWRDWVLGMRVMLADGTTAKMGSKAVKNVAGYDVQRLFVGSLGRLAAITEVTLRTFPIKAMPEPDFEGSLNLPLQGFIHRVLRSDYALARAADDVVASHPKTSTLYRAANVQRFAHDWVRPWGLQQEPEVDPTQALYEKRAKDLFDPSGRFI